MRELKSLFRNYLGYAIIVSVVMIVSATCTCTTSSRSSSSYIHPPYICPLVLVVPVPTAVIKFSPSHKRDREEIEGVEEVISIEPSAKRCLPRIGGERRAPFILHNGLGYAILSPTK
jgi:hypothetical protein